MDPYLEDPEIWSGVHASILGVIQERLAPALRPRYVVRFEERVYVTGEEDPGYRTIVPDVRVIERDPASALPPVPAGAVAVTEPVPVEPADDEIHEPSLTVTDVRDRSIVTVIEVLSPTNKVAGSFGRESFLRKRREVRATGAHWLEIDLLRDGVRTANLPRVPQTEYLVYLSRAGHRRQGSAWPISIRDRLPVVSVPLRGDDADIPLDLQVVLATVIERGSYDLDADYTADPVPPLSPDTAEWARQVVAAWRGTGGSGPAGRGQPV
jgi:hypothetical protein